MHITLNDVDKPTKELRLSSSDYDGQGKMVDLRIYINDQVDATGIRNYTYIQVRRADLQRAMKVL